MHQYCSPMSEQQRKPKCCPSSVVVFCCCCVAGMTATQGPTLAGCKVTSKTELTLHFNQSLLGTELLLHRDEVTGRVLPRVPGGYFLPQTVAHHIEKIFPGHEAPASPQRRHSSAWQQRPPPSII